MVSSRGPLQYMHFATDMCYRTDDPVLTNRMKFFDSSLDLGKPKLWKEIGLSSVGEL